MKTLIEWCSENGKIPYALGVNGAYEAGQESRQTEVDDLQKLVDKAERKLQLVQECIAENAYSNMRSGGLVIQVAELEQALKGGESE